MAHHPHTTRDIGINEKLWNIFRIAAQHEQVWDRCQGALSARDKQVLKDSPDGQLLRGIRICQHVKDLGVKLGNVSSHEAFATALEHIQNGQTKGG